MSFISQLDWRFATKKFDSVKKVSENDLQEILETIRLAPTSMGMQPFRVYVVSEQPLKEKLFTVSNQQAQVLDCSQLLIFCALTDLKKRSDEYIQASITGKTEEEIEKIRNSFYGFAERKKAEGAVNWSARQAYIALGFGLAACAELQIDSCPMEGFQPEDVDRILNLPEDIKSLAYLAIGYRLEGPKRKKFRFSEKDLFEKI